MEDDVAAKPKKKRQRSDIDDTNQAVEDTVKELKQLHSGGYTPMQYRMAEMVHGSLHSSMEELPTSTMFVRCGKGKSKQKSGSDDTLSNAISQLASALSPPAGRVSTPIGIRTSPAKLIDTRSKCYKQLSDLNNLKLYLVYWMMKSTWKRGKEGSYNENVNEAERMSKESCFFFPIQIMYPLLHMCPIQSCLVIMLNAMLIRALGAKHAWKS